MNPDDRFSVVSQFESFWQAACARPSAPEFLAMKPNIENAFLAAWAKSMEITLSIIAEYDSKTCSALVHEIRRDCINRIYTLSLETGQR